MLVIILTFFIGLAIKGIVLSKRGFEDIKMPRIQEQVEQVIEEEAAEEFEEDIYLPPEKGGKRKE